MTGTFTSTATATYTAADISAVMRNITADLVMIASSSGAMTESEAREYGHDIEVLAQRNFLKQIDITLISGGVEYKAFKYEVINEAGDLVSRRPGNAMWPRIANAELRIILTYTSTYSPEEKTKLASKLIISWVKSNADISHPSLSQSSGRDYASNGFGVQRKEYS